MDFDSFPTELESRTYEVQVAKSTYFVEKSQVKRILQIAEMISEKCRRELPQKQFNPLFAVIKSHVARSHSQMDAVHDLEHRNQIPASEIYYDNRKETIGLKITSFLLSFADQEEMTYKSENDGFTEWMAYIAAVINDVHSYHRERRNQMHFFNLVNILRIRVPGFSDFEAMGKVLKHHNKQIRYVESIIGTMDNANRRYYVRRVKAMVGAMEYGNCCRRYG